MKERIIEYLNGMRSTYTKIETLSHKILQNIYILNTNSIYLDLCRIISVIKYVGVTDERIISVECIIFCLVWNQPEAPQIYF
jgi:hypothetical protein